MNNRIEVIKFGGALMGSGESILSSADYLRERTDLTSQVVVVSAAKGITDHLDDIATNINAKRFNDAEEGIVVFVEKYEEIANDLPLDPHGRAVVANEIFNAAQTQQLFLHSSPLHPAMRDEILALGEYISAHVFNETLRSLGIDSNRIDAYEIIRTDSSFGNATANVQESGVLIKKRVTPSLNRGKVAVIPGFYGVDNQGRTTTMKRNSSDYTAAILAYGLEAYLLSLCKGVDGVYDKHPDSPDARYLEHATYQEALTLSLNGGKVVYPDTMVLLQQKQIPIHVFGLENPGRKTVISDNPL